ncbi:MAG TPA: PA2169 family four-helix-bundle protein [Gemmataceae bacterium]|nr:PA2169 family four-helix-bundle protein [Gemmataceae bacterium]
MASNIDEVIAVLNNLIETCKDRQYGYQTAAEAVSDSQLKMLFQAYEKQSAQYAAELQNEVRRLGGDPEKEGSLAGWFLRGWMNVKAAVSGGDEGAVIAECERGEDAAKSNYENALKEFLPADVQALIQRQFAGIREGHDRMRALEVTTSRP